MQPFVKGCTWNRITTGESLADTFRLERDGAPALYLKISPQSARNDLLAEKERLDWLQGRLPVPDVLRYAVDGQSEYLLLTALAGGNAASLAAVEPPERIATLLATGLRTIHALPVEQCPFDMMLDREIEEARRNIALGLVDEADFDDIRLGRSATDLFQELLTTRPSTEDLVFTHGDYCLPNIIVDGQDLGGFVDLGRAGVADRYKDIALALRSLERNTGQDLTTAFFEAYGLPGPDTERVDYYKLLDEFW